MLGIYGWFHRTFDNLFQDILNLIHNKDAREKAKQALSAAIDFGEHAIPFVKEIALLLPGAAVSEPLIDAAAKIGVKIENMLAEPDYHKWIGMTLDLAGQATRTAIGNLLPTLEHGLTIAGKVISTAAELDALPNHIFHGAAQAAYIALKQAGELEKEVKDVVLPPPPPTAPTE